jgi:hypothetical protein
MIHVTLTRSTDHYEFDVTVEEGGSQTRHQVTMNEMTYRKLGREGASPERVIEAAFEFLLEREPKESILSDFDVSVIARYFPSFEGEIAGYL